MQKTWVRSLDQEDPLEEDLATHSSILAMGNPMEREAWRATAHGVTKESNTTWQLNNNNACQANPRVMVKISEKV